MAAKPMILRELEKLPPDGLKEIERIVAQFKKSRRKRKLGDQNGERLAKMQIAAINKWAGRKLGRGFAGRDHDRILYGEER